MMHTVAEMIDRSFTDGDGSVTMVDKNWEEVRMIRNKLLALTDSWYPKDRWDSLSTTKKGEMNACRAALRDLPDTYESANDAWDNMPEVPTWSMVLPRKNKEG